MFATQRSRHLTRNLLIGVGVTIVFISLFNWATTGSTPARFIFLPLGDVGGGFRSSAGRLEWIEYASWVRASPAYVRASMPWWIVLVFEVLVISLIPLKFRAWERNLANCGDRCPICAYDLRGDLSRGCSECGWRRCSESA